MIWKDVPEKSSSWFSPLQEIWRKLTPTILRDEKPSDRDLLDRMTEAGAGEVNSKGKTHVELARESLREMLLDSRVPSAIRSALAEDYSEVQRLLDKLEHGHVHIAVFGRVSVGKSSLLNALLGQNAFSTSPIHGETKKTAMSNWEEYDTGGVFLIDTPGINEIGGEEREQLAKEVATRVDLLIFVVEGDLTDTEFEALKLLVLQQRPIIVVINKADRFRATELDELVSVVTARLDGLVEARNIVVASADPSEKIVVTVDADGGENESRRKPAPDVAILKTRLWEILEAEGSTLAALNAGLFASGLSDSVAAKIIALRKDLGDRVIHTYCLSKGVAVAINPIPVADLFAAAFIDGAMVWHLSRLYDLPVTRSEAGALVKVIMTHAAAIMGTAWAMHVVSSALKIGTAGVSTLVTAGAQGAIAYYSTLVVGKVAERYLMQGKSWGDGGPKRVVKEILNSIDRDSILEQAKSEIRRKLASD